jgi:uncharacterized protein (DUF952 family)
MLETVAYKVLSTEEFEALRRDAFQGAPVDLADGYVHLSAASQVTETVKKHFAGRTGLMIAVVDLAVLGDTVRWEVSRGNELFPHVYGRLTWRCVLAFAPLRWGDDEAVVLPGT